MKKSTLNLDGKICYVTEHGHCSYKEYIWSLSQTWHRVPHTLGTPEAWKSALSFLRTPCWACASDDLGWDPRMGWWPERPSEGFPGGSDRKASACNVGDPGSIPGLGRSSGEGSGNPLQYPCLENPMDRRAWCATVRGVAKSWTRLSYFIHSGLKLSTRNLWEAGLSAWLWSLGWSLYGKMEVSLLWKVGCCCSALKLCPTLWDPMDCSSPGFPVLHHLLEFTQTHVFWVGDAIQPCHSLLPPSPFAFNLSQHQSLFQWVGYSH